MFLLVYTHYFGWVLVLAEVAAILVFQRPKWRPILTMAFITFVSFTPWIYAVLMATHAGSDLGQNIGWSMRPRPLALGLLVLNVDRALLLSAEQYRSVLDAPGLIAVTAYFYYCPEFVLCSEEIRKRR